MSHPKTFLFTDLENSTPLWEQYESEMQPAMALHDAILTEAITNTNGQIVKSTGDGFHAVFESAQDGIMAALEGQKKLANQNGPDVKIPIKVRMGLHTGESEARAGDYFGPTVNRAARMMDIAHGGQILVSESTAVLTKESLPENVSLRDQGQHRLKGIATLEHVFQLTSPDLPTEFPPLRSLAAFQHNLPRQLTSFIGREKEIANTLKLLDETRLLTLLGPGGTGKTRLMLQTAEEVIDRYPDGVWLVELAPLTNPTKIPDRVAAALNVQEQPERDISETLFDYIRQKNLLLLLDNVEHLVRECAYFAEQLLDRCSNVNILVTGREALFISGETTLQIPSLSLPVNSQALSLEEVCRYEGIQLFLERAHAVRPDFEITEQNAATIAEIVKRLDGIPLALELAAARLRMMTVEQIAERLSDRFRLLTGGHRTALPRQQTLQALIDWSWNLLDEDEQILLRRLSVFQGGWSLSVAQEVVGFEPLDEFAVFDLMEQLINKSVVNVEYPAEGKARYSLLESIRQYAQAKLFEAGEGEQLRNRHTDYYVRFAEEAEPQLASSAMVEWLGKVTREMENLRAAMTWTLEQDPPLALRISAALLYRPNHPIQFSESRSWLIAAEVKNRERFENGDPTIPAEIFIKILVALATVYSLFSDHIPALKYIDEAISLSKKDQLWHLYTYSVYMKTVFLTNGAGNYDTPEWIETIDKALAIAIENEYDFEIFQLHFLTAGILSAKGKFEEARHHSETASEMAGKIENHYRSGEVLRAQSILAVLEGDNDQAEKALRQAIDNFAAINFQRFLLVSQSDLAHLMRRTGRVDEALEIYQETIVKWQEHANVPALAHQLESFAFVGIAKGQYDPAAKLLGKARETRKKVAAESTSSFEIEEMRLAMEQLAEAMGEDELETLMREGEKMSLEEATAFALAEIS